MCTHVCACGRRCACAVRDTKTNRQTDRQTDEKKRCDKIKPSKFSLQYLEIGQAGKCAAVDCGNEIVVHVQRRHLSESAEVVQPCWCGEHSCLVGDIDCCHGCSARCQLAQRGNGACG